LSQKKQRSLDKGYRNLSLHTCQTSSILFLSQESLTQPVPVFPVLRLDGPRAHRGIVRPRRATGCSSLGSAAASALKIAVCNVALKSEPLSPWRWSIRTFTKKP